MESRRIWFYLSNLFRLLHPYLVGVHGSRFTNSKALILLAGLFIATCRHLAEAGTLSLECSLFGKTITLTAAENVFSAYFTALTDCAYGCANCLPYGGEVPVFALVSPVAYVNFRCDNWWKYDATKYTNKWKASCAYYGTFVPNQYYTYYITARLNNQAFQNKLTIIFISGPLSLENSGPLIWTPYPPTSLVAGKSVYVTLQLKDKFGAVKNKTTGQTTDSERLSIVAGLTLSFRNSTKDLKIGFNIDQGFMWFSFNPVKSGASRAYAGVGTSVNFTAFQGSPFDMAIKPGNISFNSTKGFWLNGINIVKAGEFLRLRILLRDAYGNNITATTENLATYAFDVVSTDILGKPVVFTSRYVDQTGYLVYNVSSVYAGSYGARVSYSNNQIVGSPFPYTVVSADVYIEQCIGFWNSISYVAGQTANLTVTLRDKYRNVVRPLAGRNNFRVFRVFRYGENMTKVYESCTTLPTNKIELEIVVCNPTKVGTFSFYVESADYRIMRSYPRDLTVSPGTVLDKIEVAEMNRSSYVSLFLLESNLIVLINQSIMNACILIKFM